MILLDTDHFTALKYEDGATAHRLRSRMVESADEDFAITAITVEEQLRGWLTQIAGKIDPVRQVSAYRRLTDLIRFFNSWQIVEFDDAAAERLVNLRKAKIRIGTMDLKIAATALVNDALLLTANAKDFNCVPGLRTENWLEAPKK